MYQDTPQIIASCRAPGFVLEVVKSIAHFVRYVLSITHSIILTIKTLLSTLYLLLHHRLPAAIVFVHDRVVLFAREAVLIGVFGVNHHGELCHR